MSQQTVGFIEYTAQGGDTFDSIALAAYNEERMASTIIAVNPEIDMSDLERVHGYDVMQIMRIGRDFISGRSEEPSSQNSSGEQSETTPEPSTPQSETSESEG